MSERVILCTCILLTNRDMNNALKLLDWPKQIPQSGFSPRATEGMAQFSQAFKKLVVLQQPSSTAGGIATLPPSEASEPLIPFKVMTKEIDIHFRYHFEGDRPTNNLEKVENI